MGWIGLIIAAVGALAIVGAVINAEPLGRLPLDLARLLVLSASIVIWAGICLAILGLSSPANAAEAVPGAASWPAELASGIGVVVLAIGVVVLGIGVIQRFGLSGPLPFGAALVAVGIVLWIVSAAWASPAAAQGQVQLTSTICGPAGEITAALEQALGLRPIGGGALDDGHAALVLASPDGSRWSILMMQASTGAGCVVLAGSDWDPGVLPDKGQ